uniref:Uncharacterized protein n=1 Tax=Anguilla anguilla TaxID=7936 RepID=A0A0E9SCJ4_ANGAN
MHYSPSLHVQCLLKSCLLSGQVFLMHRITSCMQNQKMYDSTKCANKRRKQPPSPLLVHRKSLKGLNLE